MVLGSNILVNFEAPVPLRVAPTSPGGEPVVAQGAGLRLRVVRLEFTGNCAEPVLRNDVSREGVTDEPSMAVRASRGRIIYRACVHRATQSIGADLRAEQA